MGSGEAARETMAGVGMSRVQGQEGAMAATRQLPPPPRLSAEELRKMQKAQKKEKRKLEKQAKKEVRCSHDALGKAGHAAAFSVQ